MPEHTLRLSKVRLPRGRNPPQGTEMQLGYTGIEGMVRVYIKLPWQTVFSDLGLVPVENESIVLPLRLAFLCHAKEDNHVVEEIGNRLLQDGVMTWYDEKDLMPGDPWQRKIEEAMEQSDFVLVFLSKKSAAKEGYYQREVRSHSSRCSAGRRAAASSHC